MKIYLDVFSSAFYICSQVIPAINQLGVLTGYRVSYEADCASCPCTEYTCSTTGVMDVGPTAAAATLDGLRRYTDYRISVRALNRAGPGTNSDPTVVRTGEHCKNTERPVLLLGNYFKCDTANGPYMSIDLVLGTNTARMGSTVICVSMPYISYSQIIL